MLARIQKSFLFLRKDLLMSLQKKICKLQKEAKVLLLRGKISRYVKKLMELEQLRAQEPGKGLFPQNAMN
jgi:hypothetical protein